MSIFYLPEGNVVTIVTFDTDNTSNQFFGAYRTLNLAIADIKLWFAKLNEEHQDYWKMTDSTKEYQIWTCKNSGQIKTINFSRYGL